MEAFSLLKYWRGAGVTGNNASTVPATTTTTTIAETVRLPAVETDEDEDDDEGSFFDMEFMPDEDDGEGGDDDGSDQDVYSNSGHDEEDDGGSSTVTDGEREFNFTLSSVSSGGNTDANLSLSPSDDLFFKGRLVPLEPSSLDFNPSEPNSKSQFPISLLKTATKLRVFTLGFKKSKSTTSEKSESNVEAATAAKEDEQPKTQQRHRQGKFLTVKLKVEEVPIASLFTRDNSSRSSGEKLQKQNSSDEAATDDKRFSKDVVHKYLKMIKPLYVKVSRRYGEKLKLQLSSGSGKAAPATFPSPAPTTTPVSSPKAVKNPQGETEESDTQCGVVRSQKQGSLPAGLRVVCKHLGKSRSASSAVAAAPTLPSQSSRRDDSLLQQQDGIQGAILHCKKSFNATGDSETSMLSRCSSDPFHEKSISPCKNSFDLSKEKAMSSSRISSGGGSVAHACG